MTISMAHIPIKVAQVVLSTVRFGIILFPFHSHEIHSHISLLDTLISFNDTCSPEVIFTFPFPMSDSCDAPRQRQCLEALRHACGWESGAGVVDAARGVWKP